MPNPDFILIPRLEEYYRPGSRVVGWGEDIPPEFRPAEKRGLKGKEP